MSVYTATLKTGKDGMRWHATEKGWHLLQMQGHHGALLGDIGKLVGGGKGAELRVDA